MIDQAVAGTFTQFVLPGDQSLPVATHTEKLMENRAIRRQVRFADGSANEIPVHAQP